MASTPKRKARRGEGSRQKTLPSMFSPLDSSQVEAAEAAKGAKNSDETGVNDDGLTHRDPDLVSASEILNATSPVLKQYKPGG